LQDEGAVQNCDNLMQHILTNKIIQEGNYRHANLHDRCRCVESYDLGKDDINAQFGSKTHTILTQICWQNLV